MRIQALWALLGVGLLLAWVVGCSDNTEKRSVTGTVADAGGARVADATVLVTNTAGTVIADPLETGTQGEFRFTDLPAGPYVVRVVGPTGINTVAGPFEGDDSTGLTVVVPTAAQLPTGATIPTNGTATLVTYFATKDAENISTYSVQVDDLPVATTTTGGPIVITDIPAGTTSIRVTDTATGRAVTFNNIPLNANTVTVLRAREVETEEVTQPTASGTITDTDDTRVANATVTVTNTAGTVIAGPSTTGTEGEFRFTNLPAGPYIVRVTGPTGITTIYGPVESDSATNLTIVVPTANQLPAGVTIPTNGTATLVTYFTTSGGTNIGSYSVEVDDLPIATTTTGGPIVITDIPAGTTAVRVTNTATGASVTFNAITFGADTVTILRAREVDVVVDPLVK